MCHKKNIKSEYKQNTVSYCNQWKTTLTIAKMARNQRTVKKGIENKVLTRKKDFKNTKIKLKEN